MVLRLDSRFPLLWRTPSSLQFGADDPSVVFDEVSVATERMLSALMVGVTRPGLDLIARSAGGTAASVTALLRRLAPVMATDREPTERRVTLVGRGRTVDLIAESLSAEAVQVRHCGMDLTKALDATDLAIVVAHFVIEPELHGLWLRRDIAHLPIVLGDATVRIGPVVDPGAGPCLYCLERARTDAHPWWPAVEAQLWGRESPLDRAATAAQSSAIATRVMLARLATGPAPGPVTTSLEVDAATGVTRTRSHHRHPECGCSVLPGSGTEISEPSAGAATAPTRVGADAGRG
jgi:bacteriocin biosynthesis cyclodehydratase domain-containing protein